MQDRYSDLPAGVSVRRFPFRSTPGATTGSSQGWINTGGKKLVSYSPIDGEPLATVVQAEHSDYETVVKKAESAFKKFRMMPAPRRGEIIRQRSGIGTQRSGRSPAQ